MTPQELRIGNLLYRSKEWYREYPEYKNQEYLIEVNKITYDELLKDDYIINGEYLRLLVPIPLTEEWLLKFGFHEDNYGLFEKVKNNAEYKSGCEIEVWIKQCIIDSDIVWDYCIGEDISNVTHLAYIKYVHQLQNLYFALTGQELTIKL